MCGIIGFTGELDAKEVLVEGLKELEYRGYDSAGIAFFADDRIVTIKKEGKVSCLESEVLEEGSKYTTTCGIGHTRWATHGGVSDVNSHPHTSGNVTLIHNGIIENYKTLEKEFEEKGIKPVSQTDTEIAAMVINDCYNGNPVETIKEATKRLEGAYGFCVMFSDRPGEIYAIRNGSPLVASMTPKGAIIASDIVAIIKYSKDYFVVPEHFVVKMTDNDVVLMDLDGNKVEPDMLSVNWDVAAARKGGYDYFMLKEIHEQPDSIRNTIMPRITNGLPNFDNDHVDDSVFENVTRVIITACGTAMHAGLVGRQLIEKLARIPVSVIIASEFRYENPILDENTLVITISQSGETADTLAAVRLAKEKGARTLSVVNVKGSSIARESDYVLYTHAGPEIAVASTKAYTVQLSVLYLVAFKFAMVSKNCSDSYVKELVGLLEDSVTKVENVLGFDKQIEVITKRLDKCESLFFIGRGLDYSLACEGSIKLKEISYIHSESYAAGELKHGTISLITDNVPVIAIATQDDVYPKMISNIKEVRSRGAMVILITNNESSVDATLCDHIILLPKMDNMFTPFVTAVALQYIAYYTALQKGLNVDQPRNLAKSVTVE